MKFCTLTALAVISTGAGIASAQQQICSTDSIPLMTTNWNTTVTVPQFDASLGILQSIDFELTGGIVGSASIESLDAQPSTVTTDYQAAITLTRPDLSVLVVSIPNQNFVDNLDAFDGTIDFGGTSGIAHLNISVQDVQSFQATSAADLALFTGAGTIVLPVDAVGSSIASGSGNLITQFLTEAEAGVSVCYNYVADCNGNGIDDALDISGGSSNDLNGDGIPDECQPSIRRYCAGDGAANGGVNCPCGNDGNTGEGCDAGHGFGGVLVGTGIPSISNDTLVLTASQIPGFAPGFFMGSTTSLSTNGQVVFGSGLNCLVSPIRIQKFAMGGGVVPMPGAPSLSVFMNLSPGDTSFFQFWFRNGNGICAATQNATNAVQVVWGL